VLDGGDGLVLDGRHRREVYGAGLWL
jgi:hypothetical protein